MKWLERFREAADTSFHFCAVTIVIPLVLVWIFSSIVLALLIRS